MLSKYQREREENVQGREKEINTRTTKAYICTALVNCYQTSFIERSF